MLVWQMTRVKLYSSFTLTLLALVFNQLNTGEFNKLDVGVAKK